jgi:HemY protein
MLRAIRFLILLVVLAVAAVLLANWGGRVALDLPQHDFDLGITKFTWPWSVKIETSIGVLVLVVAVIAVLAALAYRAWGLITRAPSQLNRVMGESRRRRGYKALTQGMVAVAAGEAEEARRYSRKADTLLNDPPLTLLLSAQSAQLDGDEQAAKRYFEAMLEREDTRFLGLRGLLTQALREGDEPAALGYARKAERLRPTTPWVLTTLADLTERQGDLEGADQAFKDAARHKVLPAAQANRRRAVVALERALAARDAGDTAKALKQAGAAHKRAPELAPAAVLLGELLVAANQKREARRTLEKAWPAAPHPALVRAYGASLPESDGIERLKQLGKLVAGAADHPESRLALAEAALDARLWGEARRHLADLLAAPGERTCRLMARLEEAEHDDAAAVRGWLLRSAEAARDPTWLCRSCGATAERWSPRCGVCKDFDSFDWRAPQRSLPEALPMADQGAGREVEVLPPASEGGQGATNGQELATGATPRA